jgi:hypothetical protein
MILITVKGTKFDTEKPAKSNVLMILNENGNQVIDVLKITGNKTTVKEFMEDVDMIEVETSFGLTEVNEEFLWQ